MDRGASAGRRSSAALPAPGGSRRPGRELASIVQLVTYVIGGVVFIVWFHRAYGNLGALGVDRPRHGRGWAIGAWFIPIANVFIPK
jgi:hypothetical protein